MFPLNVYCHCTGYKQQPSQPSAHIPRNIRFVSAFERQLNAPRSAAPRRTAQAVPVAPLCRGAYFFIII